MSYQIPIAVGLAENQIPQISFNVRKAKQPAYTLMPIVETVVLSDAPWEGRKVMDDASESMDHDDAINRVIAQFCSMKEPRVLLECLPTHVSAHRLMALLPQRVPWRPLDLDIYFKHIHADSLIQNRELGTTRRDQRIARNAAACFIIGLSAGFLQTKPEDPQRLFQCLHGILDRRGTFGERFRHHAQQLALQYTWITAKQRRAVLKYGRESWQGDPGSPDFRDQDRAFDDSLLGWESCDAEF